MLTERLIRNDGLILFHFILQSTCCWFTVGLRGRGNKIAGQEEIVALPWQALRVWKAHRMLSRVV